jgi:hypothetical protein
MLSLSTPTKVQAPRRELQREAPSVVTVEVRVGARVRVREHHRIAGRRGMVGRTVGRFTAARSSGRGRALPRRAVPPVLA